MTLANREVGMENTAEGTDPAGVPGLSALERDVVDNYEAGVNALHGAATDDWHLSATAYFTAAIAGVAVLSGFETDAVRSELENRRARA